MNRTSLRTAFATSLTAALSFFTVIASAATQPVAPERPVVEEHFGTKVSDPYRYFEKVKSPEVMQWIDGQAQYTDKVLAGIVGRDALGKRLLQLAESSGDVIGDVIERGGGARFYLKRTSQSNQFKLYVRGKDGNERVLVDPEKLQQATGTPHAINYFAPSWDGRYVAYGLSAGGSEDAQLHFVEVMNDKEVGKPVSRAHGVGLSSVVWTPDSKTVLFNRLKDYPADAPASDRYKNSAVFELAVGADESAARPVFGVGPLPALKLEPSDYASMTTSPDSQWAIATVNDTTDIQYQVWALPLAQLGKPNASWKRIATVADGVASIALRGNELYMLSHSGAPNFRVVKLDLAKGGVFKDAGVFVPEQQGAISDFTATADGIYLVMRDAFNLSIWRMPYGGGALTEVKLPVTGSASLSHDDAHLRTGVLATAESWTQAKRTYEWSLAGGARESALRDRGSFSEMNDVEVTNVEVPSHDGVKVPLAIIGPKGARLDGSHPTIVYGYGSYGIDGYDPSFSAMIRAWTERGGVFAVAAVRGGGERGDTWHRQGAHTNKPNTWKDGIACAEYLVAKKYTSVGKLAAMGGSAGGVFAGRILTSRPDLFRAIVIQVGMTDTLRSEFSANGATNISEFGTVTDPQGFKDLLEMSTYGHVADRTAYPAVLLTHGLNDPRVDVWQSLKTAARLQKATSGNRPILLRVERQAGHGIGSTRAQRLGEAADTLSFLLWQMDQPGFEGTGKRDEGGIRPDR